MNRSALSVAVLSLILLLAHMTCFAAGGQNQNTQTSSSSGETFNIWPEPGSTPLKPSLFVKPEATCDDVIKKLEELKYQLWDLEKKIDNLNSQMIHLEGAILYSKGR